MQSTWKPHFGFILASNYKLWGVKSLFVWTGVSRYEYFEFSFVLSNLPQAGSKVLDVGSGHSLLPTILCSLGYELVGLDLDRDAMKWQMGHSNGKFQGLVADARFLPFREKTFDMGTAVSSLEHIRDSGDSKACTEIARTLCSDGSMIVTVPGSRRNETIEVQNDYAGIPTFAQRLSPLITPLFRALGVDRNKGFFERFYSVEDARIRCVPRSCVLRRQLGESLAWDSERWIHRVIPVGTNAVIELFLAHFMDRIDLAQTNSEPGGILFLMRKIQS